MKTNCHECAHIIMIDSIMHFDRKSIYCGHPCTHGGKFIVDRKVLSSMKPITPPKWCPMNKER